ncbi:hypothetical protein AB3X52_01315 [Nocardioides sp. DS6]|uniref:SRPBCC family protein n=1 Tax=Nocardioides eburneus TaxID=3231482 RepID=A0ABV3SX18_9ACTN
MGGLPWRWGATPEEAARDYPADSTLGVPVRRLTRAVDVAAPPERVYRRLCQLALAPYSYDWIDNRGRRSPRGLVPGADRIEVGQVLMRTYAVTAVEPGRSWTGIMLPRLARVFGPTAVTYAAEPAAAGTRLVCRLALGQRGPLDRVRGRALAWADVVMVRRQLLTLRALAEGDGRAGRKSLDEEW